IGWPKLDPIVNGDIPRQPRGDKIRVLWAPTHGGGAEPRHGDDGPIRRGTSRRTSWHHRDMIEQLLPPSEFELIVAPHPRHRKGKAATLAEYTRADVAVADGGSTSYVAWALDLPVVLPTWITRSGNMNSGAVERRIYKGGIGRHARCADDLPRLVVDAAEKGITLVEQE